MAREQSDRLQPTQQRDEPPAEPNADDSLAALEAISRTLKGLRYGHVTAIVRDGVVVQIDRTERQRLV